MKTESNSRKSRKFSALNRFKTPIAALLVLSFNLSAIAPVFAAASSRETPAIARADAQILAQASGFADVPANYWAAPYIDALVARNVLAGFPDGTFRPDAPVTRAQFAAMLQAVYQRNAVRSPVDFADVPANYWGAQAIRNAYSIGFLSGYPGNIFRPEQNIPREQVLVALANGLNYRASDSVEGLLGVYADRGAISDFARPAIAAATEQDMVVNYPTRSFLNPGRNATRAEVAALLYQALASEGRVASIDSPYLVTVAPEPEQPTTYRLAAGTALPAVYRGDRVVLLPEETVPLTVTLQRNIVSSDGKVLLPAGSELRGFMEPAGEDLSQFVAEVAIAPDGSQLSLSARSVPVETNETVGSGANVRRFLRNTAIGTAAAAAISAVTGDDVVATEDLLMGAAGGGLLSLAQRFLGRNSVDLVAIEPDSDWTVVLDEDLRISAR